MHRVQLEDAGLSGEVSEHAARADRLELVVIADQQHLGPGRRGSVTDLGQLGGGTHAGLVDDHQVPGAEPITNLAGGRVG